MYLFSATSGREKGDTFFPFTLVFHLSQDGLYQGHAQAKFERQLKTIKIDSIYWALINCLI